MTTEPGVRDIIAALPRLDAQDLVALGTSLWGELGLRLKDTQHLQEHATLDAVQRPQSGLGAVRAMLDDHRPVSVPKAAPSFTTTTGCHGSLSLIGQSSRSTCKVNSTFGCLSAEIMFVQHGCRGRFLCNGVRVHCGLWNAQGRAQCPCTQQHPTHRPVAGMIKRAQTCSRSLSIVAQRSRRWACTRDTTFGCTNDHTMYVSGGCRGDFLCNGQPVHCGVYNRGDSQCACNVSQPVAQRVVRSPCMRRRLIHANRTHFGTYLKLTADNSLSFNEALNASFSPHVREKYLIPADLRLPSHDVQAERSLIATLDCETFMLQIFLQVFAAECARVQESPAQPPVFIDSGANEGLWSLLAAAHGCQALAVEPQPACVRLVQSAVERTGPLRGRVTVVDKLLSPTPMKIPISASEVPCRGDMSFRFHETHALVGGGGLLSDGPAAQREAANATQSAANATATRTVGSTRLDELTLLTSHTAPVIMWHIDVEGAEVLVLRSAAHLLSSRRIRRVMLEVAPTRWAQYGLTLVEGLRQLREIFAQWTCVVACNGRPFGWQHWDSQRLGTCAFARSLPSVGFAEPADIFCSLAKWPLERHWSAPVYHSTSAPSPLNRRSTALNRRAQRRVDIDEVGNSDDN